MVSIDEFIKRANIKHNGKYDYSKVKYNRLDDKVCIICPIHGEFWQKASNHLQGQGCPKCSGKGNNQENIIQRFIETHGDKYDYSKVVFKRVDMKVCIICPIHGEFWQEPRMHIKGCGCKYCAGKDMDTKEFIRRANIVHENKYLYDKTNFIDSYTKVCIICPEHGEFWQKANNHLQGNGCPKCANETIHHKRCFNNNYFLKKAYEVHGDKYDYSKVEYYNVDTKVCIICPTHGEFWQTPYKHLNIKQGCPKCSSSRLEEEIRNLLTEHNIKFEEQKTFEWLRYKNPLFFDFYLPQYNIAIECQGGQHFIPVDFAGKGDEWANNNYKEIIERDKAKNALCKIHNVKLLYYTNYEFDYPYTVYDNKELLINEIVYDTTDTK